MHKENIVSPPLFTLTIEEFTTLQKAVLFEELLKLDASSRSRSSTSTYFNFEEAAAYLKVSKPTFSKLRKEGFIKGYKVSENRILFSESDLQQYLSDRKEY